jgi:phosphatidylglycerophosphatase A
MGEHTEAMPAKKPRVALWIATGFGLGYLPVAPGTWGSLGGVALLWLIPNLFFYLPFSFSLRPLFLDLSPFSFAIIIVNWGLALAVALAGVWASRIAAHYFKKSDPGEVVVDEISGQMLTFLFAAPMSGLLNIWMKGGIPAGIIPWPSNWKYVLLGFILFRIFDIVKPPPARQAEKWPHGWGIMADDWFAGAYAAIVLWIVRSLGWLG